MLLFRPLLRYADFRGRASRAEYLLFSVLQTVWYGLLVGLVAIAMGNGRPAEATPGLMVAFGLILVSIAALIVPNYAVLLRRLHDSGRGAVWLCLMLPSILSAIITIGAVLTAVGAVGMGAGRNDFLGLALTGLGAAGLFGLIGMVGQMVLLVVALLPGTRGPNRFGPDPRDPGALADGPSQGGGLAGYDEARLEALFAEARREQMGSEPHKPVFDFGPGSTGPMMRTEAIRADGNPAPATPAPVSAPASVAPARTWASPDWDAGLAPARPFGRRNA